MSSPRSICRPAPCTAPAPLSSRRQVFCRRANAAPLAGAIIPVKPPRRGGRAAECIGLEILKSLFPILAKKRRKPRKIRGFFVSCPCLKMCQNVPKCPLPVVHTTARFRLCSAKHDGNKGPPGRRTPNRLCPPRANVGDPGAYPAAPPFGPSSRPHFIGQQ
jgi:hypothetical protein